MKQSEIIPKAFFARYGRTMTLEENGTVTRFHAFLQPLRFKNKMYLSDNLTEIGYDTLRKFVLICPADVDITGVDGIHALLKFKTDSFCVDHCEQVYAGETPLYHWAIVHQNNNWRKSV